MKAVVQDRYGPPEVLRIEEVERPVPDDDEVLIRVHASTVTQTDTHARRPDPFLWRLAFGLRRPRSRTLGVELAGEFRAVIDRRYPMDQVVEAHRYFETWRKAGNVVLVIAGARSGMV